MFVCFCVRCVLHIDNRSISTLVPSTLMSVLLYVRFVKVQQQQQQTQPRVTRVACHDLAGGTRGQRGMPRCCMAKQEQYNRTAIVALLQWQQSRFLIAFSFLTHLSYYCCSAVVFASPAICYSATSVNNAP